MMVTATEFKMNLGKYLDMVAKEDVLITKNGKTIAKMVNPNVSAVDSLRWLLKGADVDLQEMREERRESL